ncbi:MAG: hypothetical protein WAQ27_00525 [Candidatus Microsaccharimonas sp.]
MRLFTVLKFNNGGLLYCEVRRYDDKYIAGEVINGLWNFYYDRKNEKMYAASSVKDLNEKNFIQDTKLVDEYAYHKASYREWLIARDQKPDYLGTDYNGVIAWAEDMMRQRSIASMKGLHITDLIDI